MLSKLLYQRKRPSKSLSKLVRIYQECFVFSQTSSRAHRIKLIFLGKVGHTFLLCTAYKFCWFFFVEVALSLLLERHQVAYLSFALFISRWVLSLGEPGCGCNTPKLHGLGSSRAGSTAVDINQHPSVLVHYQYQNWFFPIAKFKIHDPWCAGTFAKKRTASTLTTSLTPRELYFCPHGGYPCTAQGRKVMLKQRALVRLSHCSKYYILLKMD